MEKSSFFNSINGDRRYKAEEFAAYFGSFISNGIFPNPSTNLQVISNNDMTVTLKKGKAWINGYFYENTDDLILEVDNADGVLNRIDRVVVRLNKVTRDIKTVVKKGTFASTPVATGVLANADIHELGIAEIKVDKGTVSIVQSNITDTRLKLDVCGITNSLITVDVEMITNQISNDFTEWFDMIKDQLGEDPAGNLQNQIGDINDPNLPAELKGKSLTEQTKFLAAEGGKVKSVNEKTGAVVLNKSDIGLSLVDNVKQVPATRTVNSKTLTSDIVLNKSDIGLSLVDNIRQVPSTRKVNNKVLTSDVVIDVSDIAGLNQSNLSLGERARASGGMQKIAIGYQTLVEGSGGIALGPNSSAGGQTSIAIGSMTTTPNANQCTLGSSYDKWSVPGEFSVTGTKKFEMPHPKPSKKATHVIRHGAVESPSAGDTLYRYKVKSTKENDIQILELPDYFIHLNKDVQIFVTPQNHFGSGFGNLDREAEQLEIHCQFEGEYNILVIGTRNDDHPSVQNWDIKGVEREIGESWDGETYVFEVDEITEVEEITRQNEEEI